MRGSLHIRDVQDNPSSVSRCARSTFSRKGRRGAGAWPRRQYERRLVLERARQLAIAAITRSAMWTQRAPSNGNSVPNVSLNRSSIAARISLRARCSRVLTVSGLSASCSAVSSVDMPSMSRKHEHGAKAFRQGIDRLFEQGADFGTGHFGLGIGLSLEQRELDDAGAVGRGEIDILNGGLGAAAAQAPRRFVDGDAGEPGRELRLAAKAVEMGERLHVGHLHHIFGVGIVAHDGAGDAEQPLVIAAHDACGWRLRGARAPVRPARYRRGGEARRARGALWTMVGSCDFPRVFGRERPATRFLPRAIG